MFRLYPALLFRIFAVAFSAVAAGVCIPAAAQPAADTLYTLDGAYALAGKNGALARQILDSLERQHPSKGHAAIPRYKIVAARAFVASRDLNPRRALLYLHSIADTDELRNDPETDLFITALMCNEYQVLNRHDEMLRSMLLYLDKARKYKNRLREAVALLYLGDTYSRDGAHEKGLQHLRAAQEILRTQTGNKKVTDYLLWSRELEAEACFRAGDYSGAIRITRDLIAWYGRLTRQQRAGTEVEEDRNLHFRQAQNHISLARLYALNGETAQAAGAYAEAQRLLANTDKVLSPQMHELTLDYLKAAGRYPEALRRARQYLDEARVGDTVNLFNLAAKRQLSDIYRHLGDYPHAWNMEHQAAVLADSLYARANYETALELRTVYETTEQQAQILRQQVTISRIRTVAGILLIGIVALGIILWLLWWNGRRVKRKNRQLFEQVAQLGEARKELHRIRRALQEQEPQRPEDSDNQLYAALDRLMREQERFRDPNLTREQVAAELGTNKLYLSRAIAEHCSMTFLEYTNHLRLECAKATLLCDHTTKIEAIAACSGFNSVRTFYRLFQKYYRLTPSEFRRVASSYKTHPC